MYHLILHMPPSFLSTTSCPVVEINRVNPYGLAMTPKQQHLDIDLHVRYIQQLDTVRSQPDHKDRTLPPDDNLTRLRCASSTKMT
jgi:hypothetical protein